MLYSVERTTTLSLLSFSLNNITRTVFNLHEQQRITNTLTIPTHKNTYDHWISWSFFYLSLYSLHTVLTIFFLETNKRHADGKIILVSLLNPFQSMISILVQEVLCQHTIGFYYQLHLQYIFHIHLFCNLLVLSFLTLYMPVIVGKDNREREEITNRYQKRHT